MAVRGIRGATVVAVDEPEIVRAATKELLEQIVEVNAIAVDDIVSVIFTTTADLTSEFPARAARLLGWKNTPLLGALEMDVPGALARCIRVLVHVNTEKTQAEMSHVYLGEARGLRTDLREQGEGSREQ